MPRITREKFKTLKGVFDLFAEATIFKLISQGYFEGIESPVSIGKEANIFSALTKDRKRVILKIYRLETCDFNRMYDYIKYDPRYLNLTGNRRKVIFAWTQREYRNLLKAREAGVRVPTPITFMNNVLVLELIGDAEIAPKLKDLYPKKPKPFFNEIVDNIKKLYNAGLVHADLSAFNILNYNERPVFIDMSQCTQLRDVRAEEYLNRDIHNVSTFFRKLGLKIKEERVKEKIIKNREKPNINSA